jgi:hypothetical protein
MPREHLPQPLLELQRRLHGTPGMLFLRHWHPKQRQYTFLPQRPDGALIALHTVPCQGVERLQYMLERLQAKTVRERCRVR